MKQPRLICPKHKIPVEIHRDKRHRLDLTYCSKCKANVIPEEVH